VGEPNGLLGAGVIFSLLFALSCAAAEVQENDPPASGCRLPFVGSAALPAQLRLRALGPGNAVVEIEDGATVPVMQPPQGGRVVFLGAEATNVDPCGVSLKGVVRDVATDQVRIDARTVNLAAQGQGWSASDPADVSSFANVPLCPNQWSSQSIEGGEFEIELSITERNGRNLTRSMRAVPRCAEPENEAECRCICAQGYRLGEVCADGGKP